MKVRIGLNLVLATVFYENGKPINAAGTGIDQSARIEPIVTPNHIFCSSAFKEVVGPHTKIEFFPLGERKLAKHYGKLELYSVGENPPYLPPESDKQIKILSVTASPDSDVFYEKELDVLLESFSKFDRERLFIDMPDPVQSTLVEMENWLGEYRHDILILSSHGSESGKLAFEDEEGKPVPVTGEEIAVQLNKFELKPSIVVLSACHSANPRTDSKGNNTASPAKELFDSSEIPCVIGMCKEISQLAAIDFNRGFIDSLLNEKTAQEAFDNACRQIELGEIRRMQNQGEKWQFHNEKDIPKLFIRKPDLSIRNFSDNRIEREKPASADFEGAKFLERGFTGRRAELRTAYRKILKDKEGVIVVKGPGGIGKTRLALAAAGDLLPEFDDGVWLVELAPLADPALIPQAVASVLGLREEQGRPLVTVLTDYLRGKTALIILDNCEHLIEGCAQFADTILRAVPRVGMLASSREALTIGGEATYRVPSLAAPDPQHIPPLEALTQYDAVRLFIERAKAVMPTFEVNDANAPAVAQLCYHLDGIPLAIELAAARVRGMKVEQIAQRLDDLLDLVLSAIATSRSYRCKLLSSMSLINFSG